MIKIRQVRLADLDACNKIEQKSFSGDAASKERIHKRMGLFPQGFLVAESEGQLVGMINGISTNVGDLSKEELKDMAGFEKNGKNLIVFSLAVLPEFRGKGISKLLLLEFISISKKMNKEKILLLCKEPLIQYYSNFGFQYLGKSKSVHGGFAWHEMNLIIV